MGKDTLSPVTDDDRPGDTSFTGTIRWIELTGGEDSHDHLVDPELVLHAAMYRQ